MNETNILIHENRVGKIQLSDELINEISLDILSKIMSKLIIVKAEHLFHVRTFEYIAFSTEFRPVELREQPPVYKVMAETIFAKDNITVIDHLITFEEVK